jgi:hypothetical protein
VAADLKLKYDSAFNIATTGLDSLAASATVGVAAAEIDNTSNLYVDVLVVCQFVWAGSGGVTGFMEVYGLASNDGTIYSGDTSYSGAAAAYTLAAAGSPNMGPPVLVAPQAVSATKRAAFMLSTLFGGKLPPFWSLVFVNNSGGAALATGSTVTGRGIWYQSV